MSIPVDVARLDEALAHFGAGYLLTVTPEARTKVLTVDAVVEDGRLRVTGPSPGSARNLEANPAVTLVFPPAEAHGFTLIVDGTGASRGEDFVVTPASAILHRPSAHADGPPQPAFTLSP